MAEHAQGCVFSTTLQKRIRHTLKCLPLLLMTTPPELSLSCSYPTTAAAPKLPHWLEWKNDFLLLQLLTHPKGWLGLTTSMSITLLLPDPFEWKHTQDSSCYFKIDNKRIHSLASWVSEQGDNEFNVCSSEKHPRVLTGPQMAISHSALVALVGVSQYCSQNGAEKNLWASPGTPDSLLWTQGRAALLLDSIHGARTSHYRTHSAGMHQAGCKINTARPLHSTPTALLAHGESPSPGTSRTHARARAHARIPCTRSDPRLVAPGAPAQRRAEGGEGAAARGRGERLPRGAGLLRRPETRLSEGPRGRGSADGTRAMNPKAGGEEEDCVDSGAETGG